MARMLPPRQVQTKSPGEPEIFNRLRDDPGTADWIVIHSLDIANHKTQFRGEADFVVIVPNKGILFIEVKACTKVRLTDGVWYLGGNVGETRGPFRQASDSMHSLRETLIKARPDLVRVPFFSCVIFTHVTFNIHSVEWQPWQVIDSKKLRGGPISRLINQVFEDARRAFAASASASEWFHPQSREPYVEQCQEITDFFRPNFECFLDYKTIANELEAELKQFTDEQLIALDAMETNSRVVFAGPAGTGKTVLAVEAARRAARTPGRILFLCFNNLLGEALAAECKKIGLLADVSTIHAHMMSIAGTGPAQGGQMKEFWLEELPNLAITSLLHSEDQAYLYDYLIIDEAQDILRPTYLDFLDLSLRGGLSAGRWRMFGDFNNQAIYESANIGLKDFFERLAVPPAEYGLRINCRNTPSIATITEYFGHLNPGYKRVLRPHNGVEPRPLFYKTFDEQIYLLEMVLGELSKEGKSGRDISILSFKNDDICAAQAILSPILRQRIRRYSNSSDGYIRFCSIAAFKGLEAPVVIVTDIERMDRSKIESLMYVAVSRATQQVILLVQDAAKPMLVPNT